MTPLFVLAFLWRIQYGYQQVSPDADCINELDKGADYRGYISITAIGKPCINWSTKNPNGAYYYENHNFCRNPNNNSKPWCYTDVNGNMWGYCDIQYCASCRNTTNDLLYRGTINTTRNGYRCTFWKNARSYMTETKNYCRTPNGDRDNDEGPWCYTDESITGWDRCNVPVCGGAVCPDLSLYHMIAKDRKSSYRYGEVAIVSCQHGYHSIGAKELTVTCLQSGQWNITTPICEDCRQTTNDLSYSGIINITRNGFKCKLWKDARKYTTETENYCRTPSFDVDNYGGPWCYTDESSAKWDRCNVPVCGGAICPDLSLYHMTAKDEKSSYRYGEVAIVSCQQGYNSVGTTELHVTCLQSGHWNITLPICEAVKCHIANINRPVDKLDVYNYLDTITMSCPTGYMIIGEPTLTCGATGNWSLICSIQDTYRIVNKTVK